MNLRLNSSFSRGVQLVLSAQRWPIWYGEGDQRITDGYLGSGGRCWQPVAMKVGRTKPRFGYVVSSSKHSGIGFPDQGATWIWLWEDT
jgi:hypothetical protein